MLDRRVDKCPELGKVDNRVELSLDLGATQSEQSAVDEDVVATGELRDEIPRQARSRPKRCRRPVHGPGLAA